jgi:hypothetical protein
MPGGKRDWPIPPAPSGMPGKPPPPIPPPAAEGSCIDRRSAEKGSEFRSEGEVGSDEEEAFGGNMESKKACWWAVEGVGY